MNVNEQIKRNVLNTISDGNGWQKVSGHGRSKWSVQDKIVHVKFRARAKAGGTIYSFNISPSSLDADFEVWICGTAESFYLIPTIEIEAIYNTPGTYIDSWHPDLCVVDINLSDHRVKYSSVAAHKDFGPYFNQTLFQEPPPVSIAQTPLAQDLLEPSNPDRVAATTYRILRDTELARQVKILHGFKCQICGDSILLPDGKSYAEAHHIRPLGSPHEGPDIAENILCLCPNHHVMLDYGAIPINAVELRHVAGHSVGDPFVAYHNSQISGIRNL